MIIKIDNRETELINQCKLLLESNSNLIFKDITLLIEPLALGDIILSLDDKNDIIIERKSIKDLSASIKDGRYTEQSYRLNGLSIHNHNIIYLIEGDINKFNIFKDKNKLNKNTIYSSIVSIMLFKGFSLLRSMNIEESALIICNMACKINKNIKENKQFYYSLPLPYNEPNETNETNENTKSTIISKLNNESTRLVENKSHDHYCNVVKKVKKENITPENIGEILLCQIPSISSVTAIAIMEKFKTIQNLIIKIKEDPDCLNGLTYKNEKEQIRKISKTSLANILKNLSACFWYSFTAHTAFWRTPQKFQQFPQKFLRVCR